MARVEPRRLEVDRQREWNANAPARQAALEAAGQTPARKPSKPNVSPFSLNRAARRKLALVMLRKLRKDRQ